MHFSLGLINIYRPCLLYKGQYSFFQSFLISLSYLQRFLAVALAALPLYLMPQKHYYYLVHRRYAASRSASTCSSFYYIFIYIGILSITQLPYKLIRVIITPNVYIFSIFALFLLFYARIYYLSLTSGLLEQAYLFFCSRVNSVLIHFWISSRFLKYSLGFYIKLSAQ